MPPFIDQPVIRNFEVRRAFTAHQLFTLLKEAGHTVVLLEHGPTLFEGAETMIPQITGMLKEIGRELLVILYIPSIKRAFFRMDAGRPIIEITTADEISGTILHCNPLYTQLWRSLSVYATDLEAT